MRTAIDKLFAKPLQDVWARKMRKGLETTQCMFIGLGLKTSLSEWPRSMQVVLKTPVQAAGITYDTLVVNNYSSEVCISRVSALCTQVDCLRQPRPAELSPRPSARISGWNINYLPAAVLNISIRACMDLWMSYSSVDWA